MTSAEDNVDVMGICMAVFIRTSGSTSIYTSWLKLRRVVGIYPESQDPAEEHTPRNMAEKHSPHVLIIGAGMSGLTLAHQLKQNNITFEIFERDPDGNARAQGWALSLFGQALSDLEATMPAELGPIDQTSHLLPLDLPAQFVFYDVTRPGMRVGVKSDETGKIIRAHRQKLRDWLLQGLDVQFGKRLVEVNESGEKVTVHFEDGTLATGDILVGAEGTRSVVRKHILKGQDVMKPLALGSIVGEVALSGEDFASQLKLAHSGYIVMNSTLGSNDQSAIFSALNRVSDDGKTGYYYYILLWVDKQAPLTDDKNPSWTVGATSEQLAAFAQEKTKSYPDHLRELVDKVPVKGYKSPGFQLQGVQLEAHQLPAGRVIVIGDAAHSMTPCKSRLQRPLYARYELIIVKSVVRPVSAPSPTP